MRATDVFTPGAFPEHTYVERDDAHFERQLAEALATKGQLVSLAGPSKSGKTVLVEKVVGVDNLIAVSGASVPSADALWDRVLDWMGDPMQTFMSSTEGSKQTAGV